MKRVLETLLQQPDIRSEAVAAAADSLLRALSAALEDRELDLDTFLTVGSPVVALRHVARDMDKQRCSKDEARKEIENLLVLVRDLEKRYPIAARIEGVEAKKMRKQPRQPVWRRRRRR